MIDAHIYPTGLGHSGICSCRTSGVVNRGLKVKDIGAEALMAVPYAPLLFDIYNLKYIEDSLNPKKIAHVHLPGNVKVLQS